MSQLFGVDIAQEVADGFSGQLLAVTLTRQPISDYDSVADEEIKPSPTTYTSEGVVEQYDSRMITEGLVQRNDRKITILAKPLGTTPQPGDQDNEPDQVTIKGETFTVISVEKDPADATYTVQGRL